MHPYFSLTFFSIPLNSACDFKSRSDSAGWLSLELYILYPVPWRLVAETTVALDSRGDIANRHCFSPMMKDILAEIMSTAKICPE